jgi:hypothetical protein
LGKVLLGFGDVWRKNKKKRERREKITFFLGLTSPPGEETTAHAGTSTRWNTVVLP